MCQQLRKGAQSYNLHAAEIHMVGVCQAEVKWKVWGGAELTLPSPLVSVLPPSLIISFMHILHDLLTRQPLCCVLCPTPFAFPPGGLF